MTYVGDGINATDVMGLADAVYARSTLLALYQERGVNAIPLDGLRDVVTHCRRVLGEGQKVARLSLPRRCV